MAIGPTIENLRKKRAEEAALVAKIRELRPNDTLTQGPPDTVTDSITNFLAPIYEQITGLSPRSSRYEAEKLSGLMDFLPVVGGGISAAQAGRDFDQGNYGSAALNAGFSLLDMIPAVAAVRGGIKPAITAIPEDARRLGQNVRQFLTDESGALPLTFGKITNQKIGETSLQYRIGDDGVAEILSVRTPNAKRGQGSARKAVQELLNSLDEAGVRETRLIASPLDKKTSARGLASFYESLGFSPTGERANLLGDPWMARRFSSEEQY